jgi:hypothetical protein
MKYILTAAILVLLTGCVTVPVAQKFPEAPAVLLENCEDLIKLNDESKLSEVARTVVSNYTKYNECALKNEAWIEWYKKQKQLFEELK